jgi:hypothetical protein
MNKTLPLALICILTLSACGPEDNPGGLPVDVPEPWSTCSADDGMGGLDLGGNFMDDVPENLSVDGDVLSVIVSYGGGCERHYFEMCWPEPSFMESEPVQVNLEIWHGGTPDMCDAYLTETLEFELDLLQQSWKDQYGEGPGTITINLMGDSVDYSFE